MISRLRWIPALLLAGAVAAGCGGAKENVHPATPNELTAEQIDADPMALLPGSAVAVASVDARAFFASASFGSEVAAIAERAIPVGEEAGFKASRDVDRVIVGTYSLEGVDVAAVVVGRFDADKIEKAAQSHTPTRGGGVLVESEYAGRKVYTVSNVGFTVLTAKTALVGTEAGLRRALDRVKGGAVKRDVTPWMIETLETPNAAAAVAADFATQPLTSATVGALRLSWVEGLKAARAVADFKPPGMHVAGTLTYTEPAQAQRGADGLKGLARIASLLAVTGMVPKLQDLSIQTASPEVQVSFAVDDAGLRKLLGAVPQYM